MEHPEVKVLENLGSCSHFLEIGPELNTFAAARFIHQMNCPEVCQFKKNNKQKQKYKQ